MKWLSPTMKINTHTFKIVAAGYGPNTFGL